MFDPEKFLLEQLPLIEKRIAAIGHRKGMDAAELEEFAGVVKLRLVEDDYAILRKFGHRSSFPTFISAVIANMLLDYRNQQWGKWHASAEAERLGPLAIELERHLYRDGESLDEAFSEMARDRPALVRADLDAIAVRLPRRIRRRNVELDAANTIGTPDESGTVERAEVSRKISTIVTTYIKSLPNDDQLLLRLRFHAEMTVPQVARTLHADPQVLFRRLYKLFQDLRVVLERAGIAAQDVVDLIGKDAAILDFRLKTAGDRPSKDEESEAAGRKKEKPK